MEAENIEQDEENFIELTDEFKSGRCQTCSIIELISLFKNDEKNGLRTFEDNSIVKATKDYVKTFNKYGFSESIANKAYNTRRIFVTKDEKFTAIEQTFLVDLAPSNAQEAFALIPSLKGKFTDEELQVFLDELNKELDK